MGLPFASFHAEGAKKSCPSSLRRTMAQGAYLAPEGGTTHVPALHAKRSPDHCHDPSTQTASFTGEGGMNSMGGTLGRNGIGT